MPPTDFPGIVPGYGAGLLQELRGGGAGTLNFIKRYSDERKANAKIDAAKQEFSDSALQIANSIRHEDFPLAAQLLVKQRFDLAQKYDEATADAVTAPGFQYLIQGKRMSGQGLGAEYDPTLSTVKATIAGKNMAAAGASQAAAGASGAREGYYGEKSQTEQQLRGPRANLMGAQAGAADAAAGASGALTTLRGEQTTSEQQLRGPKAAWLEGRTNALGPQEEQQTAGANLANARAEAIRSGKAGMKAPPATFSNALSSAQVFANQIQQIDALTPPAAVKQMLTERARNLNVLAQREGREERYTVQDVGDGRLGFVSTGGTSTDVLGQGEPHEPGTPGLNMDMGPAPGGGLPAAAPGTLRQTMANQRRGQPAAQAPGLAELAAPTPPQEQPMTPEPAAQPTPTPAQRPDVLDLSHLLPQPMVQQLQNQQPVAASAVRAALADRGLNPQQVEQALQQLKAQFPAPG